MNHLPSGSGRASQKALLHTLPSGGSEAWRPLRPSLPLTLHLTSSKLFGRHLQGILTRVAAAHPHPSWSGLHRPSPGHGNSRLLPRPPSETCLHSICFSHSDAPLAHSPISDLPSSVSPLSPLVQPPWLPRCPGVHQQPPAPGPLPWRSCCLGCVPQTSAGHTPQPLTPWFRSHLPPRDPPSPRPRDHP